MPDLYQNSSVACRAGRFGWANERCWLRLWWYVGEAFRRACVRLVRPGATKATTAAFVLSVNAIAPTMPSGWRRGCRYRQSDRTHWVGCSPSNPNVPQFGSVLQTVEYFWNRHHLVRHGSTQRRQGAETQRGTTNAAFLRLGVFAPLRFQYLRKVHRKGCTTPVSSRLLAGRCKRRIIYYGCPCDICLTRWKISLYGDL